jgi:hypothetical protein
MPYNLPDFNDNKRHAEDRDRELTGDLGSVMPMAMQYYYRNKSIKDYYGSIRDIYEFMRANPTINYRYLFIP